MAKKFGKLVVFGIVAGAAAAGVYHYYQTQKKTVEDFDSFDNFDDTDPAGTKAGKREYISLDSAKTFMSDTFEKAKDTLSDTISKVSKKFSSAEDYAEDEDFDFFDEDLDASIPVTDAVSSSMDDIVKASAEDIPSTEAAAEDNGLAEESIEEFFDDEDEE